MVNMLRLVFGSLQYNKSVMNIRLAITNYYPIKSLLKIMGWLNKVLMLRIFDAENNIKPLLKQYII